MTMDVTVAICTWNRADLLRQTLERLTQMACPSNRTWELLVVNNNCTDGTDAVLESFRNRLPLRWIFEAQPGLSHARNAAIKEARGTWIVYTDDDVLVEPGWVAALLKTAERFPQAAAVGGPIEPWFPTPPDPAIVAAFPMAAKGFCGLDHGPEEHVLTDVDEEIYGANMAFKIAAIGTLRFDADFGPTPSSKVTGDESNFVRRVRSG